MLAVSHPEEMPMAGSANNIEKNYVSTRHRSREIRSKFSLTPMAPFSRWQTLRAQEERAEPRTKPWVLSVSSFDRDCSATAIVDELELTDEDATSA